MEQVEAGGGKIEATIELPGGEQLSSEEEDSLDEPTAFEEEVKEEITKISSKSSKDS